MRSRAEVSVIPLLLVGVAFVAGWAAKPPEKIQDIDCSIFDGYPIMLEARPFLDDVQAPETLDFKTRVAYVDDWSKRRASATARYDRLLEACRIKFEQQKSGD